MEEKNKLIIFLSKHWSKLLLGILSVACVAAWTERFIRADEKKHSQDFVLVSQIFERFQKGEYLASESIETAENILVRHPELHPKYDSMLALIFFSQAKAPQAVKYAHSLLKKVDAALPNVYKDYALTTLLISEENFAQAFKDALLLQEKLNGQPSYQTLDAMNLVRLLFLADRLGDKTQKKIFWEKLETLPAYASIQPLFHEGDLSLGDYIMKS